MSPNGKPKQPLHPCGSAVRDHSPKKVIDQSGDTLNWKGHALEIPKDALSGPVTFQMFEPAAPILKLVITANGSDHLTFLKAVKLTINYARCSPANLPPVLQIIRLDENDNTQDELGGTDNRVTKRVTTSINHLTGYSVASG